MCTARDVDAARTAQEVGGGFWRERLRCGLLQSGASSRELRGSSAIGEQAEVADAHEAGGEHVQQEAPQELIAWQSHRARAIAAAPIAVTEAHESVRVAEEPIVRDGNAVGVAGEVSQDLLRPGEGLFGIDHPFLRTQGTQQSCERRWLLQMGLASAQAQGTARLRFAEAAEQLAAEHAREGSNREEEVRLAVSPPSHGRQPAGADEAVQVQMLLEGLAPLNRRGRGVVSPVDVS